MTKLLFLMLLISLCSSGQTGSNALIEGETLIDSLTQNKYVLDSTYTNVAAFDSTGRLLWKTGIYYMTKHDNFSGCCMRLGRKTVRDKFGHLITKSTIFVSIGLCTGEINTSTGYYFRGNCD